MGHSFKIRNNRNPKNNLDYSLIAMIVFIIIAVVCCLISFIMITSKLNKYVDKKNTDKEYIYTVKKEKNKGQEGVYNKVPTININGYEEINKAILTTYNTIVKNNEEYNYKYKYSQSKNILSLAITYSYYPKNSQNELELLPKTYFDTYNIDLKTGSLIKDNELLSEFSVDEAKINSFLKSKFVNYYNELIGLKYFTKKECNYDCFLANRGITKDYIKDSSYYVEKGSLILLKFYYKGSYIKDYKEEDFFNEDTYEFVIKE